MDLKTHSMTFESLRWFKDVTREKRKLEGFGEVATTEESSAVSSVGPSPPGGCVCVAGGGGGRGQAVTPSSPQVQ